MRVSRTRGFLALAVIGLVALAAGCGERNDRKLRTVRASHLPYIRFAPQYIGVEEGYFDAEGLNVELVRLKSTGGALPALANGELDVVSGFLSAGLFNYMTRAGSIRIVADRGFVDPTRPASDAFVVRRGLETAGSPRGWRFSLRTATTEEFVASRLLEASGLTLDDVELINLPWAAEEKALRDSDIDVVVISEPGVTRLERAGAGVRWLGFERVVPGLHTAVVLYGPRLLEEDRETGRRFMVAHLRAVRRFMRGPEARNLELVARFTGLEQGVLHKISWPTLRRDGSVRTEAIDRFQRWAVDRGYQDEVVPADAYWEPAFVDYANRVLGPAEDGP